ncbi:MAG: sugar-binding domain-containing protein [Treponemataceae bacterium]
MESLIYDAHPVPSWARKKWTTLDGEWNFSRNGKSETVVVPFSIGTPASRVAYADGGHFVYSRVFDLPSYDCEKTHLLHIGASDYETVVVINGRTVGTHVGGYASFSFDISAFVGAAANRLELRVRDSRSMEQVRGKQTFLPFPFAVWYTGTTGVWQSVWIEETGSRYLKRATLSFDFAKRNFILEAVAASSGRSGGGEERRGALKLTAELAPPSGSPLRFEAAENASIFTREFPLNGAELELWSPDKPTLYKLTYRLFSGDTLLDEIESYAGFRSLDWRGKTLRINGADTTLRMALVQGYYPEGGYTPLSAAAMEADLGSILDMGFNGIRVHQKIENPYFQYLCDRLGILTTFEMPSFYRSTKRAFAAYERELREVMERDSMHPSCIMRMLFNETWGIWGIYGRKSTTRRFVLDMVALVKKLDPTRPVIDNSGWEHIDTDIVDVHHYLGSAERARAFYANIQRGDENTLYRVSVPKIILFYLLNTIGKETRALFLDRDAAKNASITLLSEYGGFGWYKAEKAAPAIDMIEQYTRDCLESGIFSGYCLTQLYDVEAETNGLLAFDRTPKVESARMRAINGIEAAT